jgi:ribosome-associated protein
VLTIAEGVTIPDEELVFEAIRAQGAGGQHVNKSSTAIQLRYDISNGSLPAAAKTRLLRMKDRRITKEGVVVIKAQQHRSQEQNRADALRRLAEMVQQALKTPKPRRATRPSRRAVQRRIDVKKRRAHTKQLRQKPSDWT